VLPENSVVVINELERWWERSPAGMAVIDEIIDLINREGEHCLFIVSATSHSFRFINRVRPIDNAFLGIVECTRFDAEDLQRAILLRHRPSGLKFELDGRAEDKFSDLQLAMLFNGYFDFAAGSVGVALESWIANIEKVEQDRVVIRAPKVPDLGPIAELEHHRLAWLQSFILHRRMTAAQLARLFRISELEVEEQIAILRRTGVITERAPGVLEINPYLEPFVIRQILHTDQT
jgi:hypothetical protein